MFNAGRRPNVSQSAYMLKGGEMSNLGLLVSLILLANTSNSQIGKTPPTPKVPVSTSYFGTTVTEDYRWLENIADPSVKRWVSSQDAYTRAYLDNVPFHAEVGRRLKQLMHDRPVIYTEVAEAGGRWFALKDDPRQNQKSLVVLASLDDPSSAHTVIDPVVRNPKGTTAIDWFSPSIDGQLVAVCLSDDGSEEGSMYFFDSQTGKQLPDVITGVQYPTGGGSVAWDKDGVYYTRYPRKGERPDEELHFCQQVYYHKMGAEQDQYVIGKEFPRIAEVRLALSDDNLLVSVANGDGGEFVHWLRRNGKWNQVTRFEDGIVSASMSGPYLYLLSVKNAPRGEILRVSLEHPDVAQAERVVAESDAVIKEFAIGKGRLYSIDLVGGPQQVRVFDLEGNPRKNLPVKAMASVSQVIPLEDGRVVYSQQTYTEPLSYFRYDPGSEELSRMNLVAQPRTTLANAEVVREVVRSNDGTGIPLTIIRRKGTSLEGTNPVLLYGYGGYRVSLSPEFRYWLSMWIEQGGIYAEATLRGGGEYGELWHRGGNLLNKQNVFDDFSSCAEWLMKNKYTSPERLAIIGTSNGGLLMIAVLTQHPDLFRAVVSRVGIYDMLRVELSPNGEFNTTEFGSVKDSVQFKALYAYSPYHHVRDGVKYPAVLMPVGDCDGRVNPMQSRKMVARLQSASVSGYPVLLRTDPHAGHGIGTSLEDYLSEQTDIFVFVLDQLGMGFKPEMH